jgi:hypothetical protein
VKKVSDKMIQLKVTSSTATVLLLASVLSTAWSGTVECEGGITIPYDDGTPAPECPEDFGMSCTLYTRSSNDGQGEPITPDNVPSSLNPSLRIIIKVIGWFLINQI